MKKSGPDVSSIVDILDRDNALDLDNARQTYDDGFEPIEVDWDRLFPVKGGISRDFDWEIIDDPWDDDLDVDIVREVTAMEDIDAGRSREPFPPDIHENETSIWDTCAWYQPIHFFAYDWGIFIREDCLISQAANIARLFVHHNGSLVGSPIHFTKAALRAAFATFFLHEHYHHKVESLGLRLHVVLGRSAYLQYKKTVYDRNRFKQTWLEESLANADSYHRLATNPYQSVLGKTLRNCTQDYLRATFPHDPPGYREAVNYLTKTQFKQGESLLQGQVKEALLTPTQPVSDWEIAKRLLTSYFDVRSNIYSVVRRGSRSILPGAGIPKTCSTADMIKVYQSKGYQQVKGGKGSHIKLVKPGQRPMIIPGNRKDLSPGVLNNALKNLGYSIQDLDQLVRAT